MFGIPYNLFMPFFSIYMLSLGVTDQQIGAVASLGLFVQIFSALVCGAIVDKYGRRLTVFINDLICWSAPCLIWAVAQELRYFIIAAILNGLMRISNTAWTCLMVEEAEERHLVHIWTWIMIFAVCSAAITPVGGWFVKEFGLIPAVRGLFFFGFFVLTAKFILLFFFTTETKRGLQRIEETKGRSLASLMADYGVVFKQLWNSRPILVALSLMAITNIYSTISNNFWGILFTTRLDFSAAEISNYVALRSILMTICFFVIGPRLTNLHRFRLPLWIGFSAFALSQMLLVIMPPRSVVLLSLSVVLEALAAALVSPMTESMLAISMETHERAKVSAMSYVALIVLMFPFGWIAGQLSAMDRSFPFALNFLLFFLGIVILRFIAKPGLYSKMSQTKDEILP